MQHKVTVRKKDGNWQCIVNYKRGADWKQKSKQGFKTKKDAERYSWTLLREIDEIVRLDTPKDLEKITIEQFIEIYKKDNEMNWTPGTKITYSNALKYLKPIYQIKVAEVKSIDIMYIINEMKKTLAPSTTKHYRGIFSRFFDMAVRPYRLLFENPIIDVPFNLPETKNNIKTLSIDEIDEVIKDLKNTAPFHYHVMVAVAGLSGLRYGEVLGLTWDNFDRIERTLTVDKQWNVINSNGKSGFTKTKTVNSNRTVPIPNKLVKILIEYEKFINLDILPNRIFYKLTSHNTNNMNSRIRSLGYDFTFHTLRHSYVTTLIGEGVDIQTVASLVGDTVQTVMKTYIHYSEQMRINAKKKIDSVYF